MGFLKWTLLFKSVSSHSPNSYFVFLHNTHFLPLFFSLWVWASLGSELITNTVLQLLLLLTFSSWELEKEHKNPNQLLFSVHSTIFPDPNWKRHFKPLVAAIFPLLCSSHNNHICCLSIKKKSKKSIVISFLQD